MISRKKPCKQTIDFTKKNVNKPVHVEEGPDDDDDDDGGVDDDVDAVDSWSFSCWGSLICKQNCKQTAG